MSNELAIPGAGATEINHAGRLGELERRVLVMGDEPPEEGGCCTVLCCNDNPLQDRTIGQQGTYCTVTLEDSPGVATRLAINGFVVIQARASGVLAADLAATVAATNYLERSQFRQTVADGDIVTLPMTNTVDTNATAPTIGLTLRNIGGITLRVLAVNLQVLVYGVRDGSTACGESAGTG